MFNLLYVHARPLLHKICTFFSLMQSKLMQQFHKAIANLPGLRSFRTWEIRQIYKHSLWMIFTKVLDKKS